MSPNYRFICRFLLLACLLISNIFLSPGQTQAQSLAASSRRDIDALATLQTLNALNVDEEFAQLGFRPDMRRQDWEALSPVDQIEIMYRSAQAADPPQGDEMIRQMVQITSERYESIRFDRTFQAHVADTRPRSAIRWARPIVGAGAIVLTPETKRQLDGLARYVDGQGEFGRVEVLKRIFSLESPKLESALRHRSSREVLLAATSLASPPPLKFKYGSISCLLK